MPESRDILCQQCLAELDQYFSEDCIENDHHTAESALCDNCILE